MIFKDNKHANRYDAIIEQMRSDDDYHRSIAYLFALDRNLDEDYKLNDCFDFKEDVIKPEGLEKAWNTSFDRRLLKLAFALWNDANAADINEIFSYSYDVPYLCEAIKIRFNC